MLIYPRNSAWAVWAERFTHRSDGGKIWEDLPIQTVLANASLDIAFHDMAVIGSCNMGTLLLPAIENSDDSKVSDDEYIKMFWVGLMDGDGSIQVNHWRNQSLQYRLVTPRDGKD